jgi:hypothetical protein
VRGSSEREGRCCVDARSAKSAKFFKAMMLRGGSEIVAVNEMQAIRNSRNSPILTQVREGSQNIIPG